MKKLKNLLIAVLFILVIVPLVFAETVSVRPYGIATPYWYGYSAGVKSTYYLEHPTLTANDQVVSEDATQTLTNKTLTSPTLNYPVVKNTVTNAGAVSTVVLTAVDSGGIFVNNTQSTTYTLPADPTGLIFTFVVGSATSLKVDPTGTDEIILKTADTGYYYWADALGETLVVRGISTSQWAVLSEIGTWTDGGAN